MAINNIKLSSVIDKIRMHRELLWYSSSSLVNSVIGTVGGLLVIAWVTPDDLGIWKSALILQSYVAILQAGVVHGLNRELPFEIGRGNKEYEVIASTAQAFSTYMALLLIFLGIGSFVLPLDFKVRCALAAVFFVSAGNLLTNYLSVTYRAVQNFEKYARISLVIGGVNLISLAFVYYLKFYGIIIRVVNIAFAQVLLLYLLRPVRVPLKFDLSSFMKLLKVGIPLYASGYAIQLAQTFPNTILLLEEGVKAVGLFAPAVAAFGLMRMVPKSIGQYIYARMSFRLGETSSPASLWPYAWKSSVGLLVISIPIVVVVSIISPSLIERFYPKYVECTGAIFWMLWAGTFMGAQMFGSALRSLKAWKWIGVWTTLRVGLSFVLPYLSFKLLMFSSMVNLSIGYAVAGLVSFLGGLYITYIATHSTDYIIALTKGKE